MLQAIAHQGPHRDSQANIYAVAILAYRVGWTGLIVADDLTKRQLKETCRVGESPLISVVMVAIRPKLSPSTAQQEVRVVAKRTTREDQDNTKLMETLQTFEPQELTGRGNEMFTNDGLVLHDRDRGVFTSGIATCLGWEELSKNGSTEDPSWAMNHRVQPVALPSWVNHDNQHLNIFLMFSTAEDELANIQSVLQNVARKCHDEDDGKYGKEIAIQLLPWEYHRVTSRRGFLNLWDGYQQKILPNNFSSSVYFLLEPAKDAQRVIVGTLKYDMLNPANASWQSLEQVIRTEQSWRLSARERLDRPEPYEIVFHEVEGTELIYPTEQPFYVNNPPWLPAFDCIYWVPVFYLTNKLTEQQDHAICTELHTMTEVDLEQGDRKYCCFVPWKDGEQGQRDGTLEDMWDIFWDVYTYKRGRATPVTSPIPIFFIDRQSGHDLTVIAVEPDLLYMRKPNAAAAEILKDTPASKVRGFLHGRIGGRDAHIAHANLSIGNMGFDEWTEEDRFPRPGWPGHGILEDDD